MKRRDFLKNSSTFISTLPLLNFYPYKIIENMNPEMFKFKIGQFNCTIFRDLLFKYQAKDFFINAKQEELQQAITKYHIIPDNIPSPFIAILLQDGNKNVLIDTGMGFSEEPILFRGNQIPQKGKLNQLLQEEGIKNEDITDVVITHFHPDHIGGIFSNKNQLNFPNAQFHISNSEWQYWHSSKSYNELPLFKFFVEKNITPLAKHNLNLIKGDFTEIISGIKAVKAAGHTPGQIALIIKQETNHLLYISDAFLHPLHIEKIDWQTNYDLDHKKAKKTRSKLLDLAYKENMLINGFHFDFPGLGRVDKVKNNWVWYYTEK